MRILRTEARDALLEMMERVMGQWFDYCMGVAPTSSYRHCDKSVRQEATVRATERKEQSANSGAVSNVGFKTPRDVRGYSTTPARESQTVGFQ
ncbi:hypothetical protein J1N35_004975 [Gossypium stocksii]|uniref:Uncharacterized protein n=1 Tax=Gossypium stocksii TaxID=47602 RepID=A0A9D3WEY7_9ROSI|nr:hypothetical protein J1N35_004975 [Gossypium stocksii]